MFKKILVANRGEIAVRVIRSCREMGIATVAVYSEIDRRALHVRLADEAVWIGPAPATQSYLDGGRILAAARKTGAEAIHPGYGFLSENADFARNVLQAGLVFIGPPPEAIQAMGNKSGARALMQSNQVPIVPGYHATDDDVTLAVKAIDIGVPLLIKAAAGGGGKGMRVVTDLKNLEEALAAARRESQHAFGDTHMILERFLPRARHIEFQILADRHGNILHLFERECSVQRRQQKIIEETPSPFLDEELRVRMGRAAVAAARAVGYQNAGTIEFIVDPEKRDFYFLEMNTRLQVEHPVTELVVGLDLVQWQIRIAAGEVLPFDQADLSQRGHAIECRLYAEDPANHFLPAIGKILNFIEPKGPGLRVDSGFSVGDQVTIHYDPLIAKVIAWAEDRPSAIRRMLFALRETVLLGLTHNGQFLQEVLMDEQFKLGNVYTTWIEETFGDWQPPMCALPTEVLVAAALTFFHSTPASGSEDLARVAAGKDPYSPWQSGSSFRLSSGGPPETSPIRSTGTGSGLLQTEESSDAATEER